MTFMDLGEDIRPRLDSIDWEIMRLLHTRACLVKEVGRSKHASGKSLHAPEREAEMFAKLKQRSRVFDMDFDYIAEIWSLMIWHSKQMECDVTGDTTFMPSDPVSPDELRQNLLNLTKQVAEGYDDYCSPDAIKSTLDREVHSLKELVAGQNHQSLAIDLGCGTGYMTEHLQSYSRVCAYDVSPDMVQTARKRMEWSSGTSFEEIDLETGIPQGNESVSLAVANFGAASEVCPSLLDELCRVLRPGGKALLSFYNKDALANHWFYPWPATISSRLNSLNDTLEVWAGDKVYTVKAHGESVQSVELSCKKLGLKTESFTYPTIQPLFPRFIYQNDRLNELREIGQQIDSHLAKSSLNRGTYIMTIVTKPS